MLPTWTILPLVLGAAAPGAAPNSDPLPTPALAGPGATDPVLPGELDPHAVASGAVASGAPATEEGPALWIRARRLIVRPGVELEDGALLVRDGVILAVGTDVAAPEGARRIEGEVACAGFVDGWSSLGLDFASASDASTLASTRSVDGLDPFHPPHERREALAAGVTSARVQAGRDSVLGGLGSVVALDPSTDPVVLLADACLAATVGIARGGNVPDVFDRVSEVERLAGWLKKGEGYRRDLVEYRHELAAWEEEIAAKRKELEDDFKKAKKKRDKEIEEAKEKGKEFKEEKYKEDKKPRRPRYDADDEVLARVAEGELPLVVEVNRAPELRGLLEATEEVERLRLVLAGAAEATLFATELVERRIPVLLWPSPARAVRDEEDPQRLGLALAAALADEGVEVLLGSGGGPHSRELRHLASLAVGYGLDPVAALHAITLGPARAFDVADQVGSLERGKRADVLVFDGDPLDTTARLRVVVAGGEVVAE